MGIQEEIFEEFFQRLDKEKEFPGAVVTELRGLWEKGEIASQEKILAAIKGGSEDGSDN